MNRAATQDLRAVMVWRVIRKVLDGGPAPSKLGEEAANLVTTWAEHGTAERIRRGVLLSAGHQRARRPALAVGSAYLHGWYGYVSKDLRAELGLGVEGAFSRHYCGAGSLKACRTSLWAAIKAAAEGLEKTQGSVPNNWRAAGVRIEFPGAPQPPGSMAWTNRSTFQQVIEFTGHGPTQ